MNLNDIAIEKGIPLPQRSGRWINIVRKLKPGESFLVTGNQAFNMRSYLHRWQKQTGFVLRARTVEGEAGVRVWRVK